MVNMGDLNSIFDLGKVCTQERFGVLVGISQQAVSDLKRRGIIADGQTAGEWLQRYCAQLREMAAGRAANGDLDLATERAMLARSQRERIDMQNAVTRQNYGPIDALEQGLCDCMARVAAKLETIPGKLRLANDRLTADDLDIVGSILADVRNDIANMDIDWFDEKGGEEIDYDIALDGED